MKYLIEYINCTFGINSETSATIFITLFTFFLSLILINFGKYINNYSERRMQRIMFILTLKKLSEQIFKQSKYFNSISNDLVYKNEVGYLFPITQIIPIDIFNNLGYSKTVEVFVLKSKYFFPLPFGKKDTRYKVISRLWEIIHGTNYCHQRAILDSEAFITKYNNINDLRNGALKQYNNYMLERFQLFKAENQTKRLIDYFTEYSNLRDNWQSIKPSSATVRPDIINAHLIIKHKELNSKYNELDISMESNQLIMEIEIAYINQTNALQHYKMVYDHYAKTYTRYRRLINACIKMLS